MDGQARGLAADKPDLRALKVLVATLGVLILGGTALVIGVIIHRIYASGAAPSMMRDEQAARLPAGTHVAGMAAAGNELAVWVTGAGGDRILLLDPRSGQMRVMLGPAAP